MLKPKTMMLSHVVLELKMKSTSCTVLELRTRSLNCAERLAVAAAQRRSC